jgi:hypothetical protein
MPLRVLLPSRCGSDYHPEDEPDGGKYEAPGQSGVSLGVEVEDRPHPAEHLPEWFEAGCEAKEGRQCLYWDGATP